MKTYFLIVFFFPLFVLSQTDYSGIYGFKSKISYDKRSEIKPGKDDVGRIGSLTLLKIDSTHYKFWLSLNKGWPAYHSGDIDGILEIKNTKSIFLKKYDWQHDDAQPCKIEFEFALKVISVTQETECGFGAGVYIGDDFNLQKKGRLKSSEFKEQYFDPYIHEVIVEKAFLYTDSTGTTIKKQYFIKGDKIIVDDESSEFVYIEHLTSSGKFINGWMKKSEVQWVQ
jgi:hypothetical protein